MSVWGEKKRCGVLAWHECPTEFERVAADARDGPIEPVCKEANAQIAYDRHAEE
jgi:hypothetical protein